MNENYDALLSTLIGLGFGVDPHLTRRLEQVIELDQPEFAVYVETRFDDSTRIVAKLYFGRSEQTHHRLLKFDARLYHSTEPVRNRNHTFPGDTIAFKEAFNLLQGRSVFKALKSPWSGEYTAWLQLNFDQKDADGRYKFREYSQRYGFDLEKALLLYPIEEMNDVDKKAALLASLKEGNVTPVTAVKATKTERWMIVANPQFKTIKIYVGKYHLPAAVDANREAEQ